MRINGFSGGEIDNIVRKSIIKSGGNRIFIENSSHDSFHETVLEGLHEHLLEGLVETYLKEPEELAESDFNWDLWEEMTMAFLVSMLDDLPKEMDLWYKYDEHDPRHKGCVRIGAGKM